MMLADYLGQVNGSNSIGILFNRTSNTRVMPIGIERRMVCMVANSQTSVIVIGGLFNNQGPNLKTLFVTHLLKVPQFMGSFRCMIRVT